MTKNRVYTSLVTAIVSILVGIALVAWPDGARAVICYVLGGALMCFGVFSVVRYFVRNDAEPIMRYGFALGTGALLLGLLIVLRADKLIAFFGIVIGIILLVDSVLRIQLALDIRRIGGGSWFPVLISALVILAVALLLTFNPFSLVRTATIIAGIAAILDGLLKIWEIIETKMLLRRIDGEQSTVRRVK